MASRKEEQERLREVRQQAEAGAEVQARRQRLIKLVSAAVFLAIIAIVIAIVVSQSGDDSGGGGTDLAGADSVNAQLKGLPQEGAVIGEPGAKVTLIEFGDPQCPTCALYAEQIIPQLISGPVRSGEAKLEFRPWAIIGEESVPASEAAYAAGEQGRFWNFIELFYRNQGAENSGYVDDAFLTAVAKGAGVPDIDKWNQDRKDPRWQRLLDQNDREANQLGFDGTPSLAIEVGGQTTPVSGPGGSLPQAADLEAAIRQAG
jgi:protein-disulfide isomerase